MKILPNKKQPKIGRKLRWLNSSINIDYLISGEDNKDNWLLNWTDQWGNKIINHRESKSGIDHNIKNGYIKVI